MKYIVMEIQVNGDSVGVITNSFTDRNQAESSYHTILAAAAISTIERHTAVMLTDRGQTIYSQSYDHKLTDLTE